MKEGQLLTKDAFEEMIQFDKELRNIVSINGTREITYDKSCIKFHDTEKNHDFCRTSPKPIDFIYDYDSDTYNLDQFSTDQDLLR